jgi:hypothetical protein
MNLDESKTQKVTTFRQFLTKEIGKNTVLFSTADRKDQMYELKKNRIWN